MSASLQEKIVQLICQRLPLIKAPIELQHWDEPLTGSTIGLSSVELTYLFFEIEKAFNIRIGEEHLNDYGFRSINTIATIVESCINA